MVADGVKLNITLRHDSEALALGTKTGMSTRMIYSAIKSALGNSWAWENRIPKVLDGVYSGNGDDTVDTAVSTLVSAALKPNP